MSLFQENPQELIDQEVFRLPERYREAVVLCHFEGRSVRDAAREIGRSVSCVRKRMNRAHQVLQARLARRGLCLSVSEVCHLLDDACADPVPANLMAATMTAILERTASASVMALVEEEIGSDFLTRVYARSEQ